MELICCIACELFLIFHPLIFLLKHSFLPFLFFPPFDISHPLFHLSFFFNRFVQLSLRLHPHSPTKKLFFLLHSPIFHPFLTNISPPLFLIITPSFLSQITAFFNFSLSHFHIFCTINF